MPRQLFQYQGRAEVFSTAPERITPDKWLPDQSEPAAPRRTSSTSSTSSAGGLNAALLAGAFFFVPVIQAPAPTPLPDTPRVQPSRVVRTPAAIQQAAGAFVPLVASQPALTPLPSASNPERLFRRAHPTEGFYGVDPTALLFHERVTPDKWWQPTNLPIPDRMRRAHLIPATFDLRQEIARPTNLVVAFTKDSGTTDGARKRGTRDLGKNRGGRG